MNKCAIGIVIAGFAAFGITESATAATINSVSRNWSATGGISDEIGSFAGPGDFQNGASSDSSQGPAPVSWAGHFTGIHSLNLGDSILVSAPGGMGGWGQIDSGALFPGGSASASLILDFTVDTNAAWSWVGGVVYALGIGDYASVTLVDTGTSDTLLNDAPNAEGFLLAGHNYQFSMLVDSAYNDANNTGSQSLFGDSSLVEGVLAVDEVRTTVPEPATSALFGLALVGIGAVRRKKSI
jgi:PEP-CTERM motif